MADAAGDYRATQDWQANQQAGQQQEDQADRARKLKELQSGGKGVIPASDSDFHGHGIDALRSMIMNASPGDVETAGDHWRMAADDLAGTDGNGGILKSFTDAVDKALAAWGGTTSDKFREAAGDVVTKVTRTYGHARNMELALLGPPGDPALGTAANLRKAQAAMSDIHDPGTVEKTKDYVGDGDRDDAQFHRDMANPTMDARTALEINRHNLSLSKERQVEAVIVMEELAYNYKGQAAVLKKPRKETDEDWPTEPNQISSPPPVVMPVPGGITSPKATTGGTVGVGRTGTVSPSRQVTSPAVQGISGGVQKPVTSSKPQIGTAIDGVSGGLSGTGVGGGAGGMGSGGAVAGGTGSVGGVAGGMPGAAGPFGGRGATRGGTAAGPSRGATGGRSGIPGAGGADGAGAAGRKTGAPSGGLAKQRGGVVGAAKGPGSGAKGTPGGSGLHRSRGAAGTGGTGRGRSGAMTGRGSNARPEEEEGRERERPDYLVEDAETWTPRRNIAPRVIE